MFDDILLAGISLPCDLQWTDEYEWSPARTRETVTAAGQLVFERSTQLSGRPITLSGTADYAWVTRGTLNAIKAIADDVTQGPHTLRLPDGREFTVRFRHTNGAAITAQPRVFVVPPQDGDAYVVTLRLIEVVS